MDKSTGNDRSQHFRMLSYELVLDDGCILHVFAHSADNRIGVGTLFVVIPVAMVVVRQRLFDHADICPDQVAKVEIPISQYRQIFIKPESAAPESWDLALLKAEKINLQKVSELPMEVFWKTILNQLVPNS